MDRLRPRDDGNIAVDADELVRWLERGVNGRGSKSARVVVKLVLRGPDRDGTNNHACSGIDGHNVANFAGRQIDSDKLAVPLGTVISARNMSWACGQRAAAQEKRSTKNKRRQREKKMC